MHLAFRVFVAVLGVFRINGHAPTSRGHHQKDENTPSLVAESLSDCEREIRSAGEPRPEAGTARMDAGRRNMSHGWRMWRGAKRKTEGEPIHFFSR